MRVPLIFTLALSIAGTSAAPASAQFLSRRETGDVGVLVVSEKACLVTGQVNASRATTEALDPVSLLLAGVAGDVVAAGMTALGGAIEEAAREKSYYGTAVSDIAFYRMASDLRKGAAELRPLCLMFALPDRDPRTVIPTLYQTGADTTWSTTLAVSEDGAGQPMAPTLLTAQDFAARGLPAAFSFYLEAVLETRADGFVVKPRFIWRRGRVGGSPARALPGVVHFTFSQPSTPTGFDASTFAVAQISLSPIPEGTILQGPALDGMTSGVVPMRPTTGSTETFLTRLRAEQSAAKAADDELALIDRLRPRGQAALAAARTAGARAEAQKSLQALNDRQQSATDRLTNAIAHLNELQSDIGHNEFGSTNVQARIALFRDANQFFTAVGQALKTRAATTGTTVSEALTPETRAETWTEADTQYVSAMNTVEEKRAAVNNAGEDVAAILTAELELRAAKAAANGAAAASDRRLPFPDVI